MRRYPLPCSCHHSDGPPNTPSPPLAGGANGAPGLALFHDSASGRVGLREGHTADVPQHIPVPCLHINRITTTHGSCLTMCHGGGAFLSNFQFRRFAAQGSTTVQQRYHPLVAGVGLPGAVDAPAAGGGGVDRPRPANELAASAAPAAVRAPQPSPRALERPRSGRR